MLNKDYKFSIDDLKYYDPFIYKSLKMISETPLSNEELEAL